MASKTKTNSKQTATRKKATPRRSARGSTADADAKAAMLTRLRKAQGQAAGIERMIINDRDCAEIITQISATRASLLGVAKALLHEHMKRTHIQAIQEGDEVLDNMYQDLVDLLTRMVR